MQKNSDIEALRGYAIAITFVAHLDGLFITWKPALSTFWLGGGVDLFFSISGFLITAGLMRSIDSRTRFSVYAPKFWLRRIFRIWPAAIFWSTCYMIVAIVFIRSEDRNYQSIILNNWFYSLINVQNFYIYYCVNFETLTCKPTAIWHYWSLSLEEQFYIFIPILILITPNRRILILPLLALAIWQSCTIRPWGQLLWFIRTDALLYGVAVALTIHFYAEKINILRSAVPRRAWQALLGTAIVALIAVSQPSIMPHYMGLVAIVAGSIVFLAAGNQNLLTCRSSFRSFAEYIGSRSYSLYLVHMPVIALVRHFLIEDGLILSEGQRFDQILGLLFVIAISLGLSEFSYQIIENPLRRYGRMLSEKWPATAAKVLSSNM
ncbi:acyltransferase family protein [Brucella tritici]|uniref:acyltransferase family protein n=1 Tax=Brucella tritici TaxID=94626 RepID=UPI00159213EF|nr:acyltransferase [Brucella tritici]